MVISLLSVLLPLSASIPSIALLPVKTTFFLKQRSILMLASHHHHWIHRGASLSLLEHLQSSLHQLPTTTSLSSTSVPTPSPSCKLTNPPAQGTSQIDKLVSAVSHNQSALIGGLIGVAIVFALFTCCCCIYCGRQYKKKMDIKKKRNALSTKGKVSTHH